MVRSLLAPIALGLSALVLATPLVDAQQSLQTQASTVWRKMAACAQASAKQFPDHTPDGNKQREASRLECLRINHLPVDYDHSRYEAPLIIDEAVSA